MSGTDLAWGLILAVGAAIITALTIIAHAEVRGALPRDDETP